MKINKGLPMYVRLMVMGFVVFIGVLTIIASGPTMQWVKQGSTREDFSKDKYACLQESQQSASSGYFNRYGGSSSSGAITNNNLYRACMEARGWSLREESEIVKAWQPQREQVTGAIENMRGRMEEDKVLAEKGDVEAQKRVTYYEERIRVLQADQNK